jgi:hypothetical protein
MPHHQNAGQNHNLLMVNKSFENVTLSKCVRMTLKNQNCIHEKVRSRLNLGNNYYHSVQNLLSSHLFSVNLKIGI